MCGFSRSLLTRKWNFHLGDSISPHGTASGKLILSSRTCKVTAASLAPGQRRWPSAVTAPHGSRTKAGAAAHSCVVPTQPCRLCRLEESNSGPPSRGQTTRAEGRRPPPPATPCCRHRPKRSFSRRRIRRPHCWGLWCQHSHGQSPRAAPRVRAAGSPPCGRGRVTQPAAKPGASSWASLALVPASPRSPQDNRS